ncbi:MAG: chemotaxis response regulator protein-glutamate methylesterase [Methanobacteriota archaeon]|nr:MAG: chemotaxis response regulator protein-glutamate methylesterase [Euryarchaeota archaeon]
MPDKVKVLIVDDSAYMRVILKDMIAIEDDLEVIATARDGVEALAKIEEHSPDVVLLDIQMPKMDGLATLQRIMKERPTRVIMLSAMDKVDFDLPLRALEMGAVEFISKPGGPISVDIVKYQSSIARTLRDVSRAKIEALQLARAPIRTDAQRIKPRKTTEAGFKAIVIAASTGGPRALEYVFSRLPRDIPAAIFVIQHLPPMFSGSFSKRLNSVKGPRAVVATDDQKAMRGFAYVAPGGHHLVLTECTEGSAFMKLDDSRPVQFVRPSADVLFESAAKCFGKRLLAVVLTGMGMDGANGARAVKSAGGKVIIQDETTSVIFGMPKAVLDSGVADMVAPLKDIPAQIIKFLEE